MKRLILALAMLALVAVPASAQEQRASVEGVVRDATGAVLPGVALTARSPSLAGAETTVSDAQGAYRFPALRPGRYEITAILQGFQTTKSAEVVLELGQALRDDRKRVVE